MKLKQIYLIPFEILMDFTHQVIVPMNKLSSRISRETVNYSKYFISLPCYVMVLHNILDLMYILITKE